MICPRLLALYAFLRYAGACSLAKVIFDDDWTPANSQVEDTIYSGLCDADETDTIAVLWDFIPDDRRRAAALEWLEDKMWRVYYDSDDQSFRQQIWCLYYEQPASAERLPF